MCNGASAQTSRLASSWLAGWLGLPWAPTPQHVPQERAQGLLLLWAGRRLGGLCLLLALRRLHAASTGGHVAPCCWGHWLPEPSPPQEILPPHLPPGLHLQLRGRQFVTGTGGYRLMSDWSGGLLRLVVMLRSSVRDPREAEARQICRGGLHMGA